MNTGYQNILLIRNACDNNNLIFHTINKSSVYTHSKAICPDEIGAYPIKISDCHLVAKKIGTIIYNKDDFNYKGFLKSFILYGLDSNDELKCGVDYEIGGYSGTRLSGSGQIGYLCNHSIDALGYYVYRKSGNGLYKKLRP